MTQRESERHRLADAALGEIEAPPDADDDSYAIAAAAIAAGHLNRDEKLPPHLAARVAADAEAFFSRSNVNAASTTAAGAQVIVMPAAPPKSAAIDFVRWGGWVAAAACVVIVATQAIVFRPLRPALGDARVTDRISLRPSEGVAATASADFDWDALAQRGVLHARGLDPNRSGEEYEAWIADRTPDGETLVPIGHIAISSGADESAVVDMAVQSPIAIRAPVRIVITVEPAGGVLVSSRSKVVLAGAFGSP